MNPEERLNDLIVTSTWGTPSLLSAHRLPGLPVAQIAWSDGQRLRELVRAGARVRVETEVETGWKTLRLPVARIMPEDDALDEAPYVLFGGHVDAWYFGGTDEGASNAAMLELALAFHRNRSLMRRGLVVAWWPGHSNARYGGSTWFADRFFDELRTRGVAYLNIDGVGQIDSDRFSASASPALEALALGAIREGAGQEATNGRPGRNSDQSFNGVGLPLLQINQSRPEALGGYWWWHTPDDTYDKIDTDKLAQASHLYARAIAELVAAPGLPIDMVAELAALEDALAQREQESGGALDLSEARRRTGELAEALAWGTGQPPASSPAIDRALMEVLRPIHRVMFVPGSNHHPDPGMYGRPLPGLEPARVLAEEAPGTDRWGFASAQLVRENNRILEALAEAQESANAYLEVVRPPSS